MAKIAAGKSVEYTKLSKYITALLLAELSAVMVKELMTVPAAITAVWVPAAVPPDTSRVVPFQISTFPA
jgi:hypothetical protein